MAHIGVAQHAIQLSLDLLFRNKRALAGLAHQKFSLRQLIQCFTHRDAADRIALAEFIFRWQAAARGILARINSRTQCCGKLLKQRR